MSGSLGLCTTSWLSASRITRAHADRLQMTAVCLQTTLFHLCRWTGTHSVCTASPICRQQRSVGGLNVCIVRASVPNILCSQRSSHVWLWRTDYFCIYLFMGLTNHECIIFYKAIQTGCIYPRDASPTARLTALGPPCVCTKPQF